MPRRPLSRSGRARRLTCRATSSGNGTSAEYIVARHFGQAPAGFPYWSGVVERLTTFPHARQHPNAIPTPPWLVVEAGAPRVGPTPYPTCQFANEVPVEI